MESWGHVRKDAVDIIRFYYFLLFHTGEPQYLDLHIENCYEIV